MKCAKINIPENSECESGPTIKKERAKPIDINNPNIKTDSRKRYYNHGSTQRKYILEISQRLRSR